MTAFERIVTNQVPEWAAKFDEKSKDYNSESTGWEPHTFLGVKGQFADIWRKVGKLKKALWDEEVLAGEQPREIIQDLISHLFLTLDLLGQTDPEESDPVDSITLPLPQPKGADREGPRRLGVTPDKWHLLKVRANLVINGGGPEVLEGEGFILIDDGLGTCKNCKWVRTIDQGTTETHSFLESCKYRIRPRRKS